MNNLKTFFIFGLLLVSLLLWEAWQTDYVRPAEEAQKAAESRSNMPSEANMPEDLPELAVEQAASMPELSQANALNELPKLEQNLTSVDSQKVHIKTDVIDVYLSTKGGDITNLALLNYPVESTTPDEPVQFLDDSQGHYFVTQSGLQAKGPAPTHHEQYQAEKREYVLAEGNDTLSVPLHWKSNTGLLITKTYHFHRDSYKIDVEYTVQNNSGIRFSASPYAQFNRQRPEDSSGFIYTYTGAIFSSEGNEYEKIDFDDLDDLKNQGAKRSATDGWVAMIQHYFVAALIPEQKGEQLSFYGKSLNDTNYTAGARMPWLTAESGQSAQLAYSLYLGPKEHQRLEPIVPDLDLTVDYGKLTFISQPLFFVMEWIHKLTNNWGWAIVFLTILIKLAFYKLSAASYRSMAAMRKLGPKLAVLKERYGDDKQQFNKAMMDLYRSEKANPLSGCLPMLVQMPVFLAFYWVLVESIELRQAPFILWLQDLTAADPYFILPVLFGLSMFFQQKLNPAPQDPAQAMVMKAFPIIFTVFFALFPSGLVLYWVVNNVLSIAQQWYITRKMGAI